MSEKLKNKSKKILLRSKKSKKSKSKKSAEPAEQSQLNRASE
jgi:hypothetical protein